MMSTETVSTADEMAAAGWDGETVGIARELETMMDEREAFAASMPSLLKRTEEQLLKLHDYDVKLDALRVRLNERVKAW